MWSPWKQLAKEFPAWEVRHVANMPEGYVELTDHRHRIVWMDKRLDQAERRSVLAHALEHIRAGHDGPCAHGLEEHVDELAARSLIALADLVSTLQWTSSLTEAADCLHVDTPTLAARMRHLHPAERATIRAALARREETA